MVDINAAVKFHMGDQATFRLEGGIHRGNHDVVGLSQENGVR